MGDTSSPVYFNLPDGTQVTADPRVAQAAFAQQMEEQEAELQRLADEAAEENRKAEDDLNAPSEVPEDADGSLKDRVGSDWAHMTAAQLKAEAQRRELDITSLKKKSELILVLEEDDLRILKEES